MQSDQSLKVFPGLEGTAMQLCVGADTHGLNCVLAQKSGNLIAQHWSMATAGVAFDVITFMHAFILGYRRYAHRTNHACPRQSFLSNHCHLGIATSFSLVLLLDIVLGTALLGLRIIVHVLVMLLTFNVPSDPRDSAPKGSLETV